MDQAAGPGFPWFLLLTGLACVALGFGCMARPGWLSKLAPGSPDAGPLERKWVPGILVASGIALLFAVWSQTFPFPHGAQPYWVTILAVVLHPLGGLALFAVFLWLVILRRWS
jgi:hypothetical protein